MADGPDIDIGSHQGTIVIGSQKLSVGGPDSPPPERLHLVVQKGRLFQESHPGVPVLLDAGRHLVVEIDPADAALLTKTPSYTTLPMPAQRAVVEPARASAARPPDWVRDIVAALEGTQFWNDLCDLADRQTRLSTSRHYQDAARWARLKLSAMKYQVAEQRFDIFAKQSVNVVAFRPGQGRERKTVIVCAHLDSVNKRQPGNPCAAAPGADDNASGCAGLLAMAEALKGRPIANDLRFVLFGAEEQRLLGSRSFVSAMNDDERRRVAAVVNMDMIGSLNRVPASVMLEADDHATGVAQGLAEMASALTTLRVELAHVSANSDHVAFADAGMPAVLTTEAPGQGSNHNSRIHTPRDTPDFIDQQLALDILRMNLGYVALALGR